MRHLSRLTEEEKEGKRTSYAKPEQPTSGNSNRSDKVLYHHHSIDTVTPCKTFLITMGWPIGEDGAGREH